jgi:hypothetical protein
MNPRRRRHNRAARKNRAWKLLFAKYAGGTFSNVPPVEPITLERLLATIEEVRAMTVDRYRPRFGVRLEPLPPSWLIKPQ